MITVVIEPHELPTLLLALDLLEDYAQEQRSKARMKGNRVTEATMIKMQKHIGALRSKLRAAG